MARSQAAPRPAVASPTASTSGIGPRSCSSHRSESVSPASRCSPPVSRFTAAGTALSWFVVERPLTIARPRRVALAGGFEGRDRGRHARRPPGQSGVRLFEHAHRSCPKAGRVRRGPFGDSLAALAAGDACDEPGDARASRAAAPPCSSATPACTPRHPRSRRASRPPAARVVETAYPGIGLTRLSGRLQHEWASSARQYHVDLTIVMLGVWDVAWEQQHGAAAYRALITQSLSAFDRAHGKVLWLSIMPGDDTNLDLDHFYSALPAQYPGEVGYFDIGPSLRRARRNLAPRRQRPGAASTRRLASVSGRCERRGARGTRARRTRRARLGRRRLACRRALRPASEGCPS